MSDFPYCWRLVSVLHVTGIFPSLDFCFFTVRGAFPNTSDWQGCQRWLFFGTHKAVKKFTDHCCNYLKNAAQCLRCNLFWYKLKLNPVTHNSQFMLVQQHFASLYFISPAQQLYMLTPLEALCIELIAYRRKQALLLFMIIVLSFFVYILIRLICMSLW